MTNSSKNFLERSFESIYEKFFVWVKANKYRILILVAFSILLKIGSSLPYINLLFRDSSFIYMPIIFVAVLILRIKVKISVFLILILMIGAAMLFLIRQIGLAEVVANYVYIILFAIVIRLIAELHE